LRRERKRPTYEIHSCSLILPVPLLSCKQRGTSRSLSRCLFSERMSQVANTGLWSVATARGRHEVCRRKLLFPPALKRLVVRPHNNAVSYRQKTTDRPYQRTHRRMISASCTTPFERVEMAYFENSSAVLEIRPRVP